MKTPEGTHATTSIRRDGQLHVDKKSKLAPLAGPEKKFRKLLIKTIKAEAADHRELDPNNIKRIRASLAEHRQQEPIMVWCDEKGRPILLDGQHRLQAAKELGWKKIRCQIFEGNKVAARMWTLLAGLCRKGLNALEKAEQRAEYVKLEEKRAKREEDAVGGRQPHDRGVSKAGRALGISAKTVRSAVKIAGICQKAKGLIRSSKLKNNQSALLQIAELTTDGEQVGLTKELAAKKRAPKKRPDPKALSPEAKKDVKELDNTFVSDRPFRRAWDDACREARNAFIKQMRAA